jgi:CspA family cold shock protein
MSDREFGCVTYWNTDRGFGFVKPDDGVGDSRFIHVSHIKKAGSSELPRGQRISYALGPDRDGRAMAVSVEARRVVKQTKRKPTQKPDQPTDTGLARSWRSTADSEV